MHNIIDKYKELQNCGTDGLSVAADAHEQITDFEDENDLRVIAYNDLLASYETARADICAKSAALAEKLS